MLPFFWDCLLSVGTLALPHSSGVLGDIDFLVTVTGVFGVTGLCCGVNNTLLVLLLLFDIGLIKTISSYACAFSFTFIELKFCIGVLQFFCETGVWGLSLLYSAITSKFAGCDHSSSCTCRTVSGDFTNLALLSGVLYAFSEGVLGTDNVCVLLSGVFMISSFSCLASSARLKTGSALLFFFFVLFDLVFLARVVVAALDAALVFLPFGASSTLSSTILKIKPKQDSYRLE